VAESTLAGECTPSYLYWQLTAERIWKYNPKIKLLVLLRNPIDRAFAHWNMQRFKGREPLNFFEAIKERKPASPARHQLKCAALPMSIEDSTRSNSNASSNSFRENR
jgi:hypothetical protein